MGTDDPVGKVESLAKLGGFGRLRDFGVPEDELDEVAEAGSPAPGSEGEPETGERRRGRRAPAFDLVKAQQGPVAGVPPGPARCVTGARTVSTQYALGSARLSVTPKPPRAAPR